jgi:hypothetical protein
MFSLAEAVLLDYKARHRFKKFNNIMFKIHGKEKFEHRTQYIENNINHSLGYFSSFAKNNFYQETKVLRHRLLKNQKMIEALNKRSKA